MYMYYVQIVAVLCNRLEHPWIWVFLSAFHTNPSWISSDSCTSLNLKQVKNIYEIFCSLLPMLLLPFVLLPHGHRSYDVT